MDVKRIKSMGGELKSFLAEFDDCFARSELRERLRDYLNSGTGEMGHRSLVG